jgi:hypothetical protein
MRFLSVAVLALSLGACASAPRGPTDAEVRAILDPALQEMSAAIVSGNISGFVNRFAPDGTMAVTGVMGGDGSVLNVELVGTQQIQGFLYQVGAPPSLDLQVSAFDRMDDTATQTGTWNLAGEQNGTFTVEWMQNAEGIWQVVRWQFHGN